MNSKINDIYLQTHHLERFEKILLVFRCYAQKQKEY